MGTDCTDCGPRGFPAPPPSPPPWPLAPPLPPTERLGGPSQLFSSSGQNTDESIPGLLLLLLACAIAVCLVYAGFIIYRIRRAKSKEAQEDPRSPSVIAAPTDVSFDVVSPDGLVARHISRAPQLQQQSPLWLGEAGRSRSALSTEPSLAARSRPQAQEPSHGFLSPFEPLAPPQRLASALSSEASMASRARAVPPRDAHAHGHTLTPELSWSDYMWTPSAIGSRRAPSRRASLSRSASQLPVAPAQSHFLATPSVDEAPPSRLPPSSSFGIISSMGRLTGKSNLSEDSCDRRSSTTPPPSAFLSHYETATPSVSLPPPQRLPAPEGLKLQGSALDVENSIRECSAPHADPTRSSPGRRRSLQKPKRLRAVHDGQHVHVVRADEPTDLQPVEPEVRVAGPRASIVHSLRLDGSPGPHTRTHYICGRSKSVAVFKRVCQATCEELYLTADLPTTINLVYISVHEMPTAGLETFTMRGYGSTSRIDALVHSFRVSQQVGRMTLPEGGSIFLIGKDEDLIFMRTLPRSSSPPPVHIEFLGPLAREEPTPAEKVEPPRRSHRRRSMTSPPVEQAVEESLDEISSMTTIALATVPAQLSELPVTPRTRAAREARVAAGSQHVLVGPAGRQTFTI